MTIPVIKAPRTADVPRVTAGNAVNLVIGAVIVAGLFVPVVSVLLTSRSHPLLGAYTSQLSDPVFLQILGRSLLFAVITTVVTLLIGYPVAYALMLVPRRLRGILLVAFVVPQVSSLLIRTYAWMAILGVQGPVVALTTKLGFSESSWVGTSFGVVVALVHYYLPFVVLTVWSSMRAIKPDQLRAATSLGAKRIEAFWSVYAPQSKPGVIAGTLFVFVITAAMFTIPSLLGGAGDSTVAMLIVQQVVSGFSSDAATPAAQAMILAVIVVVIVGIALRRSGVGVLTGLAQGGSGEAGRPARRRSSRRQRSRPARVTWRRRLLALWPESSRPTHVTVTVATALALVIVVAPFVYLVLISFQPLPLLALPSGEYSTRWYAQVFHDGSWLSAAGLSLQIGLLATAIALVFGWTMARFAVRAGSRAAAVITGLACVPMIIPAVTFGQGYFIVFAKLGLVGNWVAIAVVHALLILPYTYINLLSGFSTYDRQLDHASLSLGASALRTLRAVKVPLLQQFIITGALLAFLASFDEFTVTRFLTGITLQTLPVKFYGAAQQNLDPSLAAVGSVIVAALLIVCGAAGLLLLRMRKRTTILKGTA